MQQKNYYEQLAETDVMTFVERYLTDFTTYDKETLDKPVEQVKPFIWTARKNGTHLHILDREERLSQVNDYRQMFHLDKFISMIVYFCRVEDVEKNNYRMFYGHDGIIEPVKLCVDKYGFIDVSKLSACVKKHLDGIEELNVEIKGRGVEKISDLTEQEIQIADYMNTLIANLTRYGVREIPVKKPSLYLSWSNGGEQWIDVGRIFPKKTPVIKIDANEFLVPLDILKGFDHDETHRVILTVLKFLDYLPLFGNSFEAKVRKAGLDKIKGSGFEYLNIEKEPIKW